MMIERSEITINSGKPIRLRIGEHGFTSRSEVKP
jgi:hypothetical protein